MKTQIFLVHGNCTHLLFERDFFQGHNRNFKPSVRSHLLVGNTNGELQPRHLKNPFVMEGSETRLKTPAHHGKGSKKKGGEKQKTNKLSTDPNVDLACATNALAVGSSSLAPADFCGAEEELDEIDEDDELTVYRGLVLDLSYRPINVVSWKRALCLEILEKADVLEYYDQAVQAPNRAYLIPAVLRVSSFVHSPKSKKIRLNLNRNNIFLRDKFRCQYCNKRDDLTIDHVLAASRGGGWEWNNLVTACSSCNVRKGDKTLEECRMKLIKPPREPKELDSMDLPPNYRTYRVLNRNNKTPTEWLDYLPSRPPLF